MDEEAKTIALGPRSRKASSENKNPNSNVIQDTAETAQDTKLITQNRRRKSKILITRDDEDPDLR